MSTAACSWSPSAAWPRHSRPGRRSRAWSGACACREWPHSARRRGPRPAAARRGGRAPWPRSSPLPASAGSGHRPHARAGNRPAAAARRPRPERSSAAHRRRRATHIAVAQPPRAAASDRARRTPTSPRSYQWGSNSGEAQQASPPIWGATRSATRSRGLPAGCISNPAGLPAQRNARRFITPSGDRHRRCRYRLPSPGRNRCRWWVNLRGRRRPAFE